VTTTILLVRHAAHLELGELLSGRRRDIALSNRGLEQTAILADLLGAEPIAAVYSSPRQRAWDTARDIAEPHGLRVAAADGLDEVDFGDWAGRPFSALEGDAAWSRWNEARGTACAPGGETMTAVVARATAALKDLASEHRDKTIAAVSHGDVIRGAIAHHLGLPLDNLLRFDVDTASVSRLAIGDWGARVLSVNERICR
jgi:probable phosphoglycerate mutase